MPGALAVFLHRGKVGKKLEIEKKMEIVQLPLLSGWLLEKGSEKNAHLGQTRQGCLFRLSLCLM